MVKLSAMALARACRNELSNCSDRKGDRWAVFNAVVSCLDREFPGGWTVDDDVGTGDTLTCLLGMRNVVWDEKTDTLRLL